jgi:transcriptional regulator with XRE-family HTH domain
MDLSQKLKKLRKEKNLSQQQLARMLKVTGQAVSKWENGKSYPDILNLINISNIFNVSLDELIKEDKEVQKSLYNKGKIKNIYIVILGLILEAFSYLLSMYFDIVNIDNSIINSLVLITFFIGLMLIVYVIYNKLPRKVKNLLDYVLGLK